VYGIICAWVRSRVTALLTRVKPALRSALRNAEQGRQGAQSLGCRVAVLRRPAQRGPELVVVVAQQRLWNLTVHRGVASLLRFREALDAPARKAG